MLVPKKPDLEKNNPHVKEAVERQKKREAKLHPLRINAQTIILVPRGKCNKKYAEEYRNRLKRVAVL